MDLKLELVTLPVSDVDRAKTFYVDQVGFNADHDHRVTDDLRFVQLTPPDSACSISIGTALTEAKPGSAARPLTPPGDPSRARRFTRRLSTGRQLNDHVVRAEVDQVDDQLERHLPGA